MTLTAEKTQIPDIERMPNPCPICDSMISLGLISATCESLPPAERNRCRQLIKPLEEKKKSAVDTLAAILVEIGDDQMNDSLDRMNTIIWQATEKAKQELIARGRINADGTPK